MKFSKTAKLSGASGFFFDGDKDAPADSVTVKDADVKIAINIPAGASFDFDTDGAMTITPALVPSAAEIKTKAIADRWGGIKAERDRRKSGGFMVNVGSSKKWFHSDADSRIQHLGLKDRARDTIATGGSMTDNLAILGQPVKWKTMDGSFAAITAQLAFDIVAAAGDLDARLFAVAESHRTAMEAAADPSSYDFSAGWPETFGG